MPLPSPHATTLPVPVAAEPSLFVPGRTCWRVEQARRIGIAIDAENYFTIAKEAMRRARRSILLTAWDLDPRMRLTPHERPPRRPDRLGHFLNWLATKRPHLEIRVLKWDYAELFDIGRGQHPLSIRRLFTHPRLDYRLDSDHPTGACHHQKLLIVDDALAFCGGLDLTANRWDTRAHRRDEPNRRQPDGQCYEPFHDIMMAVDGDAARALGDLFRERWLRATGQPLAPTPPGYDPWPAELLPVLLREHPVAVARTDPHWGGRPEVREVEALYLDGIAAAKRTIYLESQYFAAQAVAEALRKRLAEPDGPEVVVVNPVRANSWLENQVMVSARNRLARQLKECDPHGRFRLYAPVTDQTHITVHAKVMVIDDRLLRIGSANLNNRSMGLDTECDLAIEARAGDPREAEVRAAVTAVRDDLLGEHLGVAPEALGRAVQRTGSLIGAIESLRRPGGMGRTLEVLETPDPGVIGATMADTGVLDPERPVPATELVGRVLPSLIPRQHTVLAGLAILLVLGGLYALWSVTDLKVLATLDAVMAGLESLRGTPLGPVWLVALYVLAGLVVFPITVLIAATAIVLGPLEGFVVAMTGALASSAVLFWIGRTLGRRHIERFGGPAVARASARLARSGILAVATIRVVPVAPFTVINLVAGASRIRFRDFVVGTLAGIAPGTLAFSLLGNQLERTLRNPTGADVALLVGLAAVAVGLGWAASRVLGRTGWGGRDS
ncbi:VTT domain-containing protein [Azospirillum sp.]|uniref:VTT domain-containing protein n=1 Tax=Azospirillum sp. TaxID=34012 RepID=UPI003D76146F